MAWLISLTPFVWAALFLFAAHVSLHKGKEKGKAGGHYVFSEVCVCVCVRDFSALHVRVRLQ